MNTAASRGLLRLLDLLLLPYMCRMAWPQDISSEKKNIFIHYDTQLLVSVPQN